MVDRESARDKVTGSNILRALLEAVPVDTLGLSCGEVARRITGAPANCSAHLVRSRLDKLISLGLVEETTRSCSSAATTAATLRPDYLNIGARVAFEARTDGFSMGGHGAQPVICSGVVAEFGAVGPLANMVHVLVDKTPDQMWAYEPGLDGRIWVSTVELRGTLDIGAVADPDPQTVKLRTNLAERNGEASKTLLFRAPDVPRALRALEAPAEYGLLPLDIVSHPRPPRRPTTSKPDPIQSLRKRVRQHAQKATPKLLAHDVPVRSIDVGTVTGTDMYGAATAWILNERGARLGTWYRDTGLLLVFAEQLRARITESLEKQGTSVLPVLPVPGTGRYLDAIVRTGGRGVWRVDLVANLNPINPALWTVGWFDESSGLLVVRHETFGPGMDALLRRHGLETTEIREDHDRLILYGYKGRSDIAVESTLREEVEALRAIRGMRAPIKPYEAVRDPHRRSLRDDAAALLPAECVDAVNRHLRPVNSYGEGQPCLLCGQPANHNAGIAGLCFGCTGDVQTGVLYDLGLEHDWEPAALWAIRELANDFQGPPSRQQLAMVPTGSEAERLRGLLLRLLVPVEGWAESGMSTLDARKVRSWSEWLAVAGVLTDGWRPSRGIISTATDGHLCLSLLERHIDDFFNLHDIPHEREPAYPFHSERNLNGLRADWRLIDGTLVEALGFPGNPQYESKLAAKRLLAAGMNIRLVEIKAVDLGDLKTIFADWMTSSSISRTDKPQPFAN